MKTTLVFLHFEVIYDQLIHTVCITLSHETGISATACSSADGCCQVLGTCKGRSLWLLRISSITTSDHVAKTVSVSLRATRKTRIQKRYSDSILDDIYSSLGLLMYRIELEAEASNILIAYCIPSSSDNWVIFCNSSSLELPTVLTTGL